MQSTSPPGNPAATAVKIVQVQISPARDLERAASASDARPTPAASPTTPDPHAPWVRVG
ncbi:hypothetical protein [Lentzea sp. NPDC051838]|uniref:hypothetical protein n=1 Tax=Lentzea sp. NPDC051838 TaxID=3154849 RepID=UPI0034220BD4